MISVGLDISLTSTGVSINNSKTGSKKTYSIKTTKNKVLNDSDWHELDRYEYIVSEILKLIPLETDIVAIEDIFIHENKERLGASLKLISLGFIIRYELNKRKIKIITAMPKQIKSFATGKGGASKEMMMRAAEALRVNVANDDEADAFHLSDMGVLFMKMYNREEVKGYNNKQKEVIRTIFDNRVRYNFPERD